MDVIQHAIRNRLPLICLSTDFFKAFDSISIPHIRNCLELFQFPQKFTRAFMRLAENGTAQFEINGQISEDHRVDNGTGQGDPRSCDAFNMAVEPLNHWLANSPAVPRYVIDDFEVGNVAFADDGLLLLQGDKTDECLITVQKIEEFYQVSGLKLNPAKCEVLFIHCDENEATRFIQTSGMKRVQVFFSNYLVRH